MCRQPPSVRFYASQILAWVMVVAVSVLWQPRTASRPAGNAASQLHQQALADKAQGPRGSLIQRQSLEDRQPLSLGALLPPLAGALPDWHPKAQLLLTLPKPPLMARLVSGLPQPRAPPVRFVSI